MKKYKSNSPKRNELVISKLYSLADEMNSFAEETKIRKLVRDLVQPTILRSNDVMIETQAETEVLTKKLTKLEKVIYLT